MNTTASTGKTLMPGVRIMTWDGHILTAQKDGSVTDGKTVKWDSLERFTEGNDYTILPWEPVYSSWRHGGWYVNNVLHLTGACGCVSNNYPDKKWRIVCDRRRGELGEEGDFTFPTRDAAARAEFELAAAEWARTSK